MGYYELSYPNVCIHISKKENIFGSITFNVTGEGYSLSSSLLAGLCILKMKSQK